MIFSVLLLIIVSKNSVQSLKTEMDGSISPTR